MKRRALALVLALALCLGFSLPALAAEDDIAARFPAVNPFPGYADVKEGDWFADNARLCYEVGLLTGTGTGFSPNTVMTVAEMLTLSARIHLTLQGGGGLPASTPWYQSALDYLTAQGIRFDYLGNPGDPALRWQMFDLFSQVFPVDGLPVLNHVTALPDEPEPGDLLLFYNAGILSGLDQYGTFGGEKTLTRAEAAAIVSRLIRPELRLTFTLQEGAPAPRPAAPGGVDLSRADLDDPDFDLVAALAGVPGDQVLWENDGIQITAQQYYFCSVLAIDACLSEASCGTVEAYAAAHGYEQPALVARGMASLTMEKLLSHAATVSMGSPLSDAQNQKLDQLMDQSFYRGRSARTYNQELVAQGVSAGLEREIYGLSINLYAENAARQFPVTEAEFNAWAQERGLVRFRIVPLAENPFSEEAAMDLAEQFNAAADPYAAFQRYAHDAYGYSYSDAVQEDSMLPGDTERYSDFAAIPVGKSVQYRILGQYGVVQRVPPDYRKDLERCQLDRVNARMAAWGESLGESASLTLPVSDLEYYTALQALRVQCGLPAVRT